MTKTYIILCFAIFWQITLHAQEDGDVDEPYRGFRLFITNVQVLKDKSSYKRIQYDIINTGRQKIKISAEKQIPKDWIQLRFDDSWANFKLDQYTAQFKTALVAQGLSLELGQMLKEQELKFSTKPEVVTTIAKQEELPKDEPTDLAKKSIDNKSTSSKEKEVLAEVEPIEQEVSEKKTKEKKPKEKKTKEKKDTGDLELPTLPVVAIATSTDACADLIFEDVKVVKQTKRYATIQFTIKNIGDGAAKILGATNKLEDNIAVRAYVSGIPQLTRGALTLGGTFINDGFDETNPAIAPDQTHVAQLKVDITKRTRYMNNLILSLDDYYTIQECDKTNNVTIIQL